jgi:hypothetical protein
MHTFRLQRFNYKKRERQRGCYYFSICCTANTWTHPMGFHAPWVRNTTCHEYGSHSGWLFLPTLQNVSDYYHTVVSLKRVGILKAPTQQQTYAPANCLTEQTAPRESQGTAEPARGSHLSGNSLPPTVTTHTKLQDNPLTHMTWNFGIKIVY